MHLFVYLSLIALAYAATAAAEIYRWKDEDGHVVYSDTPQPGAEIVELSEPTIIPAQPVKGNAEAEAQAKKPPVKPYESVSVTSPGDEQTIRENIADIGVSVSVRPALQVQHGHRLQLLFDGQEVAEPGRAVNFALPNVDRGAHTLQAVILDASGSVLTRSPISTFFVHKQTIQRRAQ